jgi:dTMP kinase
MQKGLFIVLDGNDGSGKATQSALLRDGLIKENRESVLFDFPGYDRNFFGALLGECLAGQHGDFVHLDPKIASALYALDRLESSQKISDALKEGKVVIADRFVSSNQIHQGGKIEDTNKRIEFLTWLDTMEHEVLQIPRPDLIVYLKVPVEISLELLQNKRAAKNQTLGHGVKDTVEEDRDYLTRSHETANWLVDHQGNWKVIPCVNEKGMRTREDIQIELKAIVDAALGS